jgi:hypothetical protein
MEYGGPRQEMRGTILRVCELLSFAVKRMAPKKINFPTGARFVSEHTGMALEEWASLSETDAALLDLEAARVSCRRKKPSATLA